MHLERFQRVLEAGFLRSRRSFQEGIKNRRGFCRCFKGILEGLHRYFKVLQKGLRRFQKVFDAIQ